VDLTTSMLRPLGRTILRTDLLLGSWLNVESDQETMLLVCVSAV
jgi:hypothetical protein